MMKKLAILAATATVALTLGSAAEAACDQSGRAAMFCAWTFKGDYVVKAYDANDGSFVVQRGELCGAALARLRNQDPSWEVRKEGFPTSNARGETYLLDQSCLAF